MRLPTPNWAARAVWINYTVSGATDHCANQGDSIIKSALAIPA
jgi:hypothetical protein